MKLRRTVGGWLVRLGQRIARPTIADMTDEFDRICIGDTWLRTADPARIDSATHISGPIGPAMLQAIASRSMCVCHGYWIGSKAWDSEHGSRN